MMQWDGTSVDSIVDDFSPKKNERIMTRGPVMLEGFKARAKHRNETVTQMVLLD